jgi:hypothetical protein
MMGYGSSCRPACVVVGDHEELIRLVRASSVRAGLAQRARIVLLASEGLRNGTKTADDILDKINRKRISTPDH